MLASPHHTLFCVFWSLSSASAVTRSGVGVTYLHVWQLVRTLGPQFIPPLRAIGAEPYREVFALLQLSTTVIKYVLYRM